MYCFTITVAIVICTYWVMMMTTQPKVCPLPLPPLPPVFQQQLRVPLLMLMLLTMLLVLVLAPLLLLLRLPPPLSQVPPLLLLLLLLLLLGVSLRCRSQLPCDQGL